MQRGGVGLGNVSRLPLGARGHVVPAPTNVDKMSVNAAAATTPLARLACSMHGTSPAPRPSPPRCSPEQNRGAWWWRHLQRAGPLSAVPRHLHITRQHTRPMLRQPPPALGNRCIPACGGPTPRLAARLLRTALQADARPGLQLGHSVAPGVREHCQQEHAGRQQGSNVAAPNCVVASRLQHRACEPRSWAGRTHLWRHPSQETCRQGEWQGESNSWQVGYMVSWMPPADSCNACHSLTSGTRSRSPAGHHRSHHHGWARSLGRPPAPKTLGSWPGLQSPLAQLRSGHCARRTSAQGKGEEGVGISVAPVVAGF